MVNNVEQMSSSRMKLTLILNTVEFFSLAVFIINLPFAFTEVFDGIVYRICIVAFVSVLFLSGRIAKVARLIHFPGLLAMLFLFLLHVVALSYTTNLKVGFFLIEKIATFALVPLLLVTTSISKKQFQTLLTLFVLSVTLAATICLGFAFYRDSFSAGGVNWLFFTYYDLTDILGIQPNYLALYCCFAVAIILNRTSEVGLDHSWLFWCRTILAALFLSVFVILCSGRMQIFILMAVVSGYILIVFHRYGKLRLGIGITCILLAALVLAIFSVPVAKERFLQAMGQNKNAQWTIMYGNVIQKDVRQAKWDAAFRIIKNNWLLGIGTGDVQDALQGEYLKIGFKEALDAKFNAHNQFLQTLLTVGIFGLICLVACFTLAITAALKASNILYFSFVAITILCCFTESVFERQFGITWFAVFNSLFIVIGSPKQPTS